MSREKILIILGVLVLISPWSGLPLSWLSWILPLLGLAVAVIGFTLRPRNTLPLPPASPASDHAPHADEPSARSSHIAFS